MTGLECLKEELLRKGYTKQQVESKILIGVIEAVSGSDGRYTDMSRIEQEISGLEKKKETLMKKAEYYQSWANYFKDEFDGIIKAVNSECDKRYEETKTRIDRFQKALTECETPEARDALKTAQMFINSVDVDTKYDNTAFIIGLASILSQGRTAPIEELQKINSKIPHFQIDAKQGFSKAYTIREKGKMETI